MWVAISSRFSTPRQPASASTSLPWRCNNAWVCAMSAIDAARRRATPSQPEPKTQTRSSARWHPGDSPTPSNSTSNERTAAPPFSFHLCRPTKGAAASAAVPDHFHQPWMPQNRRSAGWTDAASINPKNGTTPAASCGGEARKWGNRSWITLPERGAAFAAKVAAKACGRRRGALFCAAKNPSHHD